MQNYVVAIFLILVLTFFICIDIVVWDKKNQEKQYRDMIFSISNEYTLRIAQLEKTILAYKMEFGDSIPLANKED